MSQTNSILCVYRPCLHTLAICRQCRPSLRHPAPPNNPSPPKTKTQPAESDATPRLAFPFVQLFGADARGCFEAVASLILGGWTDGWFESFPAPPVTLLRKFMVRLDVCMCSHHPLSSNTDRNHQPPSANHPLPSLPAPPAPPRPGRRRPPPPPGPPARRAAPAVARDLVRTVGAGSRLGGLGGGVGPLPGVGAAVCVPGGSCVPHSVQVSLFGDWGIAWFGCGVCRDGVCVSRRVGMACSINATSIYSNLV